VPVQSEKFGLLRNTCPDALRKGIDPEKYLRGKDAYHFFNQLNDLFVTGPTRTNVMDVICLLISKG
jgi:glycerate 2-kinase